jgi:urease accessory protein
LSERELAELNIQDSTSNIQHPVGRGARGVQGHLELICAADAEGRSYLRHQSFRAPIHLSKPHLDGGALVVNVVNPTAGLLAGDRIRYDVQVESGARLLLTAPSANRLHQMRDGHAEVRQEFRVAAGGFLESWPELMIPQAGSRYRQHTTIHIVPGGELFLIETLAPGRVASGEVFQFEELAWATDLWLGDLQLARERYVLAPKNGSITPLRQEFPTAYYACVFLVAAQLGRTDECWSCIHNLHDDSAWVGVSSLGPGSWIVKLLAQDSLTLRRKLNSTRMLIYTALGREIPSLRRGWI